VARYVVRYILDNKPSPGVLKVKGVEIIAMFSPIKYLVETDNEGLAHLEKHLSIAWVITSWNTIDRRESSRYALLEGSWL
jgi:hypothetical protein